MTDDIFAPTTEEWDEAYAAGWRSETLWTNPYKQNSVCARVFVDGWHAHFKANKLGLEIRK